MQDTRKKLYSLNTIHEEMKLKQKIMLEIETVKVKPTTRIHTRKKDQRVRKKDQCQSNNHKQQNKDKKTTTYAGIHYTRSNRAK